MVYDVIIVGAGAVGLATALQLLKKRPGLKVVILEKESAVANHQTGNNSNVIHSGIYYKPGSLKARNCIYGYQLLLEFCREHNLPFNLCGKVIVATDERELPLLNTIYERGIQNGLTDLKKLNAQELKTYEPHVAGIAGIHVPQTGIVDYRVVAEKYAEVYQHNGGELKLNERVTDIKVKESEVEVVTPKSSYTGRLIVNCAGLYSDKIARFTSSKLDVKIIPFRGEYYKLKKEKEHLVKTLIYPVPDPNFPFLGVHFTTMVDGGVECGPNAVLAFQREGYKKSSINLAEFGETLAWPGFRKTAAKYWKTGIGEMYRSFSKSAFTKALQKLIPEIQENDLIEGGAGVRAQACDRTGGLLDDFLILEEKMAVNVCNAPSPAATSSLSIGETVADLVLKRF
ncbi:MAG TPA: L-2-hydroxyglutarate oxidase [Ohtaekwangia sp.]|nr:L-2-hydroxyglutarate oxidase [Ohtaekwangia sp.]